MFDKLINRIGVSLALVLMICELTYVNAKSLLYMSDTSLLVDEIMSWVGALAYSMVTVVVMRKTERGWFKLVFPVFDAVLMFLGFNLFYADLFVNGGENLVRLYLSVFLAVFTGFTTYSLGLINYRDHAGDLLVSKTELNSQQSDVDNGATELLSEVDSLLGDFEKCQTENNSLRTHINSLESDVAALQTEIEDKDSDHKSLRHQLNDTQKQLTKYRGAYLKSEASRIRKKNEANRTPEENEILRLMEAN